MAGRRSGKSGKKPVVHRPHKAARSRPATVESEPGLSVKGTVEPVDLKLWMKTRSGATAGRGYHYQETFGALLAAEMLEEAGHAVVVPEGSHEDLDCRGPRPSAVQAKSRQGKKDDFPASEVARHLVDLHQRRIDHPPPGLTVLAIERDVKERGLPSPETTVGDLEAEHPLALACARVLANNALPKDALDDIVIRVISTDDARRQAAEIVARACGVEVAVAERIVLEFRQLVCDAADANAERRPDDPAFLDRTGLVLICERMKVETDPSSLTEAIRSGSCEPMNLDTRSDDPTYFQGVHAQPGHIAAGLATGRPDLVEAVGAGLATSGSVLLCGPSGVGKSTVMWLTAWELRHFTWFRVNRLHASDVEDLYRLADGRRPTPGAPVGFLVDGVGLGDIEAWDALVRRITPLENVFVIGTARVEDTFEVTTLTHSSRVDVGLDEDVAARIFAQLREAGLAKQAHWAEAYAHAKGLTLEYTYFLTRGKRLGDVLRGQVQRLISEADADAEVQLLGLTTTAHMHGAALSIEATQAALGLSSAEVRRAVARLKDEHFIVETSGDLMGLHLMRSRTLSSAVHENPPPSFQTTVRRLFESVRESELARLIVGVLRERDDVDGEVIAAVVSRVEATSLGSDVLGAVLHAFKSSDFLRHARTWRDIILEEDVPPAQWPITVDLALLTSELVPGMNSNVAAAVPRLRALADEPTNLWNQFVAAIGMDRIVAGLANQNTAGGAASLLAACRNGHRGLVAALRAKVWSGEPLQEALSLCSVDDFAVVTKIAQVVSVDFAHQLVALVGGEDAVFAKVRNKFSTLYNVGRVIIDDMPAVKARLVFIDDDLNPEPRQTAVAVARLLLRAVPGCEKADIETLRAGGQQHAIGDLKLGTSGLLYEYSLTSLEVDWNRIRSVLVLHELGFVSPGEHAARVAALIPRVATFIQVFLTLWTTQRDEYLTWSWDTLNAERKNLVAAVDQLTAPQDGVHLVQEVIPGTGDRLQDLADREPADETPVAGPKGMQPDHAHTVLSSVLYGITDQVQGGSFRQLSFRARNVATDVEKVASAEQWELAGLPCPPPALADIAELLYKLADIAAAVTNEVLDPRTLVRTARAGPRPRAVERVAAEARRASRARFRNIVEDVERRLPDLNVTADVFQGTTELHESYWPHADFAVVVECDSVLEWVKVQQPIATVIQEVRGDLYLPATLVCPSIRGRREPALAFEVMTSVHMHSPKYATWFPDDDRSDGGDTLPSDVDAALGALLRRSGLHYLAERRTLTPGLQAAYDATESTLNEAIERLRDRGADECVDAIVGELASLAMLVNGEAGDEGTPGGFADTVLNATMESESDVVHTVLGLRLCAVQWTHDVDTAILMVNL